ncbi:Glycosyltransferase involved in cell wall bisynthesis [Sinosporangium album]|uniref:Glycosyltransferase involved in cell wall bisynthesis n=1 Tax=Sinosporangium album TaxID=504805 RepID=A0A1G8A6X8_9ACTN|nr:glycosyltransferase family 4 protein [Sinosporangium album]SDH16633.1 Glycosyltransferase involved in cell wall bisynthesis [Sinosporangium album]
MSGVLSVFGGYGPGATSGAERMAWRTTAGLARRGHTVAAMTDAVRPAAMAGEPWPVLGTEAELLAALPGWRPDVVHAYDLALPGPVRLARELADRYGARFVLTPASTTDIWPDKALGAELCAAARAVFTLTEAESAAIRAVGAPGARLFRLPQAPDLEGGAHAGEFRRRHRVDGPMVLFLGRRVATKGYRTLLDAAPLVWHAFPDTVFAFGGPDGEPEATAAFSASRDGRILNLGMIDDRAKHDALAACDVLALPTRADVFPLVFAEAWSCGRPVVSGSFAGVSEVVRHGVDGLVVGDRPPDVADALTRLLGDERLRTSMGAAGRRRVEREMSWEHVARAVEAGFDRSAD